MLGKAPTLGFWLTDTALEAALVRPGRKASKTVASTSFAGHGLLSGQSTQLAQAFRACLKGMPRVVRRADTPAVLALPDSFIEEDVFRFADFPKNKEEARALVTHRLSREMNVLPDDLDVSWEAAAEDGDVFVRVRAMNSDLRREIEAGAASAGLRLVRIDGWVGFAQSVPQIAKQDAGSAVWCDGAEWSLLCWGGADAAGFSQTGVVQGPDVTASDIVRLSLSYARRNEIAPGPLSADVTDALVTPLSAAAKRAGIEALALPANPRAAQVATWG